MGLGYDAALLAKIAERFARAVMQDIRYSVKALHGLRSVEPLHAGVLTGLGDPVGVRPAHEIS